MVAKHFVRWSLALAVAVAFLAATAAQADDPQPDNPPPPADNPTPPADNPPADSPAPSVPRVGSGGEDKSGRPNAPEVGSAGTKDDDWIGTWKGEFHNDSKDKGHKEDSIIRIERKTDANGRAYIGGDWDGYPIVNFVNATNRDGKKAAGSMQWDHPSEKKDNPYYLVIATLIKTTPFTMKISYRATYEFALFGFEGAAGRKPGEPEPPASYNGVGTFTKEQ
jgi:hypothetical protein